MPQYKIAAIADETRPWASERGGPMVEFRLQLADQAGKMLERVALSQKVTSNPPVVGQVLDLEIEDTGQWGLKAKKVFAQAGGGGRGMSPEDRASIVRQHTQKVLPDWLNLMFTLNLIEPPKTKKDFLDLAAGVMDWLVADVKRSAGKA